MPAGPHHWFEEVADHLGEAYLRYSFTKGTTREVEFLIDVLGLAPGMRALDVGCGPGRHAIGLAARGVEVVGVDISAAFVRIAGDAARRAGVDGASFVRADARALDRDAEFDVAYAMCQGGFGLQAGPAAAADDPAGLAGDRAILAGMRRAVRPGGRVGVAAFSAYFQVRHLEGGTDGSFEPATGVHHELTEILDPAGRPRPVELWTTCFTPRELHLLAESVGLEVLEVHSVTSGERYERAAPELDEPEFFLVAARPDGARARGDRPGSPADGV